MTKTSAANEESQKLPVLKGMEGIKSYWDVAYDSFAARIMPGELYVTKNEELITTVLGSCISVCIRDTHLAIGGMNHFMLPEEAPSAPIEGVTSNQYGPNAMEVLINTILSNGGNRNRLEVKVFGGATVLSAQTRVGEQNIKFVREYLRKEGMLIATEDLGGLHPRKIIYFPLSGRALMRKIPIDNREVVVENSELASQLDNPVSGDSGTS